MKVCEAVKDKLPEHTFNEPLPKTIPANLTITCNIPGDKHKTILCDGTHSPHIAHLSTAKATVEDLQNLLLDKYKKIDISSHTANKTSLDYLLKVSGESSRVPISHNTRI